MGRKVIVIGAGIGGLSAAINLARQGFSVTVYEAGTAAGGLASGLVAGPYTFDSGPYILLDLPGLQWAFEQLQIDLQKKLKLLPVQAVYEVTDEEGNILPFDKDLEKTTANFEKSFPGSGRLYSRFVEKTFSIHNNLKPLSYKSHPSPLDAIRNGSLQYVPFLLSSLETVLKKTHLPGPIRRGISIWTHIAGQPVSKAPSPMAFVPGLFHQVGSFYPVGGIREIPLLLETEARKAGVEFRFNTRVRSIVSENKKITGIITESGETVAANAVISNAGAIATYKYLTTDIPEAAVEKFSKLPLQSPGGCAYLMVKGKRPPYYIRFKLTGNTCVAFIQPGLLDQSLEQDGWYPARLLAPLPHATAEAMTQEQQLEWLNQLLEEKWWQEGISDFKVLHLRTSLDWGKEFNLYRNSMNPVMTSKFMLQGRFAHKSPFLKGLYLAGSSTHPGQWVSFCAISGVLASHLLIKDLSHA